MLRQRQRPKGQIGEKEKDGSGRPWGRSIFGSKLDFASLNDDCCSGSQLRSTWALGPCKRRSGRAAGLENLAGAGPGSVQADQDAQRPSGPLGACPQRRAKLVPAIGADSPNADLQHNVSQPECFFQRLIPHHHIINKTSCVESASRPSVTTSSHLFS